MASIGFIKVHCHHSLVKRLMWKLSHGIVTLTYLFRQVSNTAPPTDSYTTLTPFCGKTKTSAWLEHTYCNRLYNIMLNGTSTMLMGCVIFKATPSFHQHYFCACISLSSVFSPSAHIHKCITLHYFTYLQTALSPGGLWLKKIIINIISIISIFNIHNYILSQKNVQCTEWFWPNRKQHLVLIV